MVDVSTPEPEIVVAETAEALAASTAERVTAVLGTALRTREEAHLVVTGGGILEKVLGALAQPPIRGAIEWQRVHVWWGDERFVAADSDERNDRPAMSLLFDHVAVDPARLHRMPASDAAFGNDAEAAGKLPRR